MRHHTKDDTIIDIDEIHAYKLVNARNALDRGEVDLDAA